MADPLEGPPLAAAMFDPEESIPGSLVYVPWTRQITAKWQRWFSGLTRVVIKLATRTQSGTGSPEGIVTANVGTIYLRSDGGAGSVLYVKESGNGNTGWIAK